MKRLVLIALAALLSSVAPPALARPTFRDQTQAQRHCPADVVVWVNLKSGVYHMPGTRWYGATESGAYICKREADGARYRQSRNGQ
jgi:hypothetical protein